jgi:hypothetical protein
LLEHILKKNFSLLKKVSLAPKIGKIEIMFISNLNQKKKRVWEENLNILRFSPSARETGLLVGHMWRF